MLTFKENLAKRYQDSSDLSVDEQIAAMKLVLKSLHIALPLARAALGSSDATVNSIDDAIVLASSNLDHLRMIRENSTS